MSRQRDPFANFDRVRRQIDELFGDVWTRTGLSHPRPAGFTPRVVQEAPDSYTILALVAAGVGVTLTLTSCQHVQQTGLVYRPLTGRATWLHSALAWRRDNPSAALTAVLCIAEEALPTPARH